MGPVVLASQLAAGIGVIAGAMIVKNAMEHTGMNPMSTWDRPRCATCNGTGRVTCLCSRWSDGDTGCRTCSGSGRMACRSCGGSGTGRPLPVQISVRSNRPPPYS
ncbi:Chaperone protein dnaJ-related [Rhynchospora pubera]|uniref:Chaperone protein dnaJ-related n=1 Tax=Rhynchospora pubera TaxID=906938 RepID=A0AAV8CNN0_9POAL|nr:Chaperone protein dnaJ-related [Rhynchospora pubera]